MDHLDSSFSFANQNYEYILVFVIIVRAMMILIRKDMTFQMFVGAHWVVYEFTVDASKATAVLLWNDKACFFLDTEGNKVR